MSTLIPEAEGGDPDFEGDIQPLHSYNSVPQNSQTIKRSGHC